MTIKEENLIFNKGKLKVSRTFLFYSILVLLPGLVFLTSLFFGYVNLDDNYIILRHYKEIGSFSDFWDYTFSRYMDGNYFRPVVNASFALNFVIAGQKPFIFHFTNYLIHILNVILLFKFLSKLDIPKHFSFYASLVFSVHPLFTNAIVWIAGRNDLILTFFTLIFLISIIKFFETNKFYYILINLTSFFLATYSKESAVLSPLLSLSLLLVIKPKYLYNKYNFVELDNYNFFQKIFKSKLFHPLLLIGWLSILVVWYMTRNSVLPPLNAENLQVVGFHSFLANLPSVPEIISKFFLPIDLSLLPSYSDWNTYSGIVIIVAIIGLMFYLKEIKNKYLWFAFIWFGLFAAPALIIKMANIDIQFDYLECRAYSPSVAFLIIIFILYEHFKEKLNSLYVQIFAVVLVAAMSAGTFLYAENYRSPENFWVEVIDEYPDKVGAYIFLAEYYINREEVDKSIDYLNKAIERKPNYARPYQNLYTVYNLLRQERKAMQTVNRYLEVVPNDTTFLKELLDINLSQNMIEQADLIARKLLDMKYYGKVVSSFYINLAEMFYAEKKYEQATEVAEFALGYFKNIPLLYSDLGIYYVHQGMDEKALEMWHKSIELDSNFINPYKNLNNYYKLNNDMEKAGYYAQKVLELSGR